RLIGVGFVDPLPIGPSAIYFYYDPELRDRSLGTFNVLSIIDVARRAGLPHVYLGYFVNACRSLEYKAKFRPNETRDVDGVWRPFI
ncbi:arginyltransferase, partial [Acinetobacter baumannii]